MSLNRTSLPNRDVRSHVRFANKRTSRNSSGSFATLAAIRRASSFGSNLAAARRSGSPPK
jgi:hypothetical protein